MAYLLPGTDAYEALSAREKLEQCHLMMADADFLTEQGFEFKAKLEKGEIPHWVFQATLEDPYWDFEKNLFLPDKGGKHVCLEPKPAQHDVIEAWVRAWTSGQPLRLLIPKARRHGISQIVSALIYRHCRSFGNQTGLVVAHEEPAAKEIFSKYRYYHQYDPFGPSLERGNVGELRFGVNGSQIIVRTAGSSRQGIGHGFGYHCMHLSEAGLYQGSDPYALISGLLNAVPPRNEAWSAVIMESTGNGQQGMFYELCMKAHRDPGSTEWELLFLPWTRRYDAWRTFCGHPVRACECDENRKGRDTFMGALDGEELLLHENYSADAEQLNWRRWTYKNDIVAFSEGERRRKMRSENPVDLTECFQVAGTGTFDAEILHRLILEAPKPKFVGKITAMQAMWDKKENERVHDTPPPKLFRQLDGPLAIWEYPKPGHQYTMGIDLAQGAVKGDFHVMSVFDRTARKIVARFRTRGVTPLSMINPARLLSRFYNNAYICPEINFFPQFTEILANTDRAAHLYWRKDPTRTKHGEEYQRAYGWRTTPGSKRNLVSMLQDKLENEPEVFTDKMLLQEMSIFREVSELGKDTRYPGAVGGDDSHDDIVIAAALALYCDFDMPMRRMRAVMEPDDWGRPKLVSERVQRHVELAEEARREVDLDVIAEEYA